MIAIESFKKFRIIDFLVILILVLFFWLASFLLNLIPNSQLSFILSIFVLAIFVTFTSLLLRKAGSVTLFYFIAAILTSNINNFGISGSNKVFVFLVAGIVFELIFLLLKFELRNIPIDIVVSETFSSASIPVTTALLLSFTITKKMLYSLVNLSLLFFILGIAGSVAAFLVWYNLRTTKLIMKFEYMQ